MSKQAALAHYVEIVVEDFAERIDPEEERYKTHNDLAALRADLTEVIDGRVADWQ